MYLIHFYKNNHCKDKILVYAIRLNRLKINQNYLLQFLALSIYLNTIVPHHFTT